MRHIVVIALFALSIAGCAAATQTPVQWATMTTEPWKTFTPWPTNTPRPTITPTATASPISSVEKELQVYNILVSLVRDKRYDPTQHVLHKVVDTLKVELNKTNLTFIVTSGIDNADDSAGLAAELILVSSMLSNAGKDGDWGLTEIAVLYPGPLGSSAKLYVSNQSDIVKISKNQITPYDVMQVHVEQGSMKEPPANTSPSAPTQGTTLQSDCSQGCTEHIAGCDIKGNVSFNTGEKIYHVPGGMYYDSTVIDPRFGERWFCTEAEAIGNGWRKSAQ